MAPDPGLERAIQALLDGRPISRSEDAFGSNHGLEQQCFVIDALARAHRTALFGSDAILDRVVDSS
jgi:hypothetical protein